MNEMMKSYQVIKEKINGKEMNENSERRITKHGSNKKMNHEKRNTK